MGPFDTSHPPPPTADRRLAEPHYQLGLAHELLGDLPAAVRHLRLALAVLRADPAHAELAAGVALKVEDLEEEIQRAPANRSPRDTRGRGRSSVSLLFPSGH